MPKPRVVTLGDLKRSSYTPRSVKDEIRANLLQRLASGAPLFPGIVGYDDTVVPRVVNALLSRQNFILLGLRGQAKSRIVRQLVEYLDPAVPVVAGSEIHDDPLRPVSRYARQLVAEQGDDTPVEWVPREARFVEKLATPDVTIADLIGDVDPIRAARGGHLLADELTIHFGLLPRANRGIFALNELPDLAGKVQVGLFNIMQEGDIQIKGYPVRLPLDLLLVFTANPEDYTARGKIITPLKDRIGAEVVTHYPERIEDGVAITLQEAWTERGGGRRVELPGFMVETIERIAFLAREDKRIDQRSGVSQRMPISVLETVVSNAERRALLYGEEEVVPRMTDLYAALPAITGKLELEYEGELIGAEQIARELIARSASDTVMVWGGEPIDGALDEVVAYFEGGGVLQLADGAATRACLDGFTAVPGLLAAATAITRGEGEGEGDGAGKGKGKSKRAAEGRVMGRTAAACELVLEGLVGDRRISRSDGGRYGRVRRVAGP